jgi:hypothetical protein
MSNLMMFKIEEKFSGTEDLYDYLLKNIKFIGKSIGVQIQEPLKDNPFCITGKEKITERNILFFASKSEFPESLGELIALAGAFEIDIIVYFAPKISPSQLDSLNWLKKICNEDTEFILGEADF